MVLFNPVILSVITMIGLCLINLNVMFALIIAALVGGLAAGMDINSVMSTLINGMGGNAETSLSYIMLGTFAVFINQTGLAGVLAYKIANLVQKRRFILISIIILVAMSSQNIVPVHIAFIPILIPPLLPLMNEMKMDRRVIAMALAFGLKAPYISIPIGFGLIFQNIIVNAMKDNGIEITLGEVSSVLWIIGAVMLVGLLIAVLFVYNKDRIYESTQKEITFEETEFQFKHYMVMVSAVIAFAVQLKLGSLPLGALMAITFLALTKVVSLKDIDSGLMKGINIMGLVAFVMLVASGYASVIRESGAVQTLVNSFSGMVDNKVLAAFVMLLIGLVVTMGIGTSFGTIPILATIYCPLALELGFTPLATAILIGAAGALGDAGSPASDTTLGPTSGLNIDGQHNHIWDTCVPTFVFYNIPIFLAAWVLSQVL